MGIGDGALEMRDRGRRLAPSHRRVAGHGAQPRTIGRIVVANFAARDREDVARFGITLHPHQCEALTMRCLRPLRIARIGTPAGCVVIGRLGIFGGQTQAFDQPRRRLHGRRRADRRRRTARALLFQLGGHGHWRCGGGIGPDLHGKKKHGGDGH